MKIDRCMCVMQIIQRSFNFLKSYRFFGAPLNRVPRFQMSTGHLKLFS